MIPLRKTSVYTVQVPGDDAVLADMVSRCPAELAGSGTDRRSGTVFIRVRVANDSDALEAALAASDGQPFTLATGYGVNQREVTSRPPEGCFCHIMPKPSACLTCTCPYCGVAGRFGVSTVHHEGCGS